jgi:hypothetical protein
MLPFRYKGIREYFNTALSDKSEIGRRRVTGPSELLFSLLKRFTDQTLAEKCLVAILPLWTGAMEGAEIQSALDSDPVRCEISRPLAKSWTRFYNLSGGCTSMLLICLVVLCG